MTNNDKVQIYVIRTLVWYLVLNFTKVNEIFKSCGYYINSIYLLNSFP